MKKNLCAILLSLTACFDTKEIVENNPMYRPPGQKADAGYDGGYDADAGLAAEERIYDESSGVNILMNELQSLGYLTEKQDGTWNVVLQTSQTDFTPLTLEPDVRFKKQEIDPYSYLEFNSDTDSGVGIFNYAPLYMEIEPNTEEGIRDIIRRL